MKKWYVVFFCLRNIHTVNYAIWGLKVKKKGYLIEDMGREIHKKLLVTHILKICRLIQFNLFTFICRELFASRTRCIKIQSSFTQNPCLYYNLE